MTMTAMAPTARHDLFVTTYMPTVTNHLSARFRSLSPDAREEIVQDGQATAWKAFQDVGDRAWDGQPGNRVGKVTPLSIATFIGLSAASAGRRFLGAQSRDALSPGCAARGHATVHQIHGNGLHDVEGEIPTALLTRDQANPATQVRVRLDWDTIAQRCSPGARRVLYLLIEGWRNSAIGEQLGITLARVSQIKTEIRSAAVALGYTPQ